MPYRVVFSPRANAQLEALFSYLEGEAGAVTASGYTGAIVSYCRGFDIFPHRGTRRDELRPGLRTIGFRRRVTIAFDIDANMVTIIGIFYGGQDFEAIVRSRVQP